jgi:hypothetical protein
LAMVARVSPVASEIIWRWKVRWISMAIPLDNRDGLREQLRRVLLPIPLAAEQ